MSLDSTPVTNIRGWLWSHNGPFSRFDWPKLGDDLYRVEMRFAEAPDIGKSDRDFYVLYIDPKSYRLVGYEYANGYQPLLDLMNMPEGKEVFGPLWREITRYEEVGGLLFPSAFHTLPGPDERIVGNHLIMNIDISTPFEYERAAVPEGAIIFAGELKTTN